MIWRGGSGEAGEYDYSDLRFYQGYAGWDLLVQLNLVVDGGFDFLHHFDEVDLAFGEFGEFGVGADFSFEIGQEMFVGDFDGFLFVFELVDFLGLILVVLDDLDSFGIVVDGFLGLFEKAGSLVGGDFFS